MLPNQNWNQFMTSSFWPFDYVWIWTERFLPDSKAWEIVVHVISTSVITQVGLRSYPTGSYAPEYNEPFILWVWPTGLHHLVIQTNQSFASCFGSGKTFFPYYWHSYLAISGGYYNIYRIPLSMVHWQWMHYHKLGRDDRCTWFLRFSFWSKFIQNLQATQTGKKTGRPLVAISTMVSTLDTTVCGSSSNSTIPQRSVVLTMVHLWREVIPSACMEALMQHFQAAGFSEAVSRLAQHLGEPQQITWTTTDGFASLTGLQNKKMICLVPQLLR